jgi:hypothetical protein
MCLMLSLRCICKFLPLLSSPLDISLIRNSIIGPLAQSQSHAFATALLFAQDYGIIAAGMEDRPFVPISTVVLEGVPRDLKPCFRKWTDDLASGGTEALMAGVKRGRSLRCVGLDAALAATRRDR